MMFNDLHHVRAAIDEAKNASPADQMKSVLKAIEALVKYLDEKESEQRLAETNRMSGNT